MKEEELVAAKEYILRWLEQEGFSAAKWDKQSQDGHWLVYCLSEADGSTCSCCLEPMIESARPILVKHCGWEKLHVEAMWYMATKAARQ